MKVVVLSTSYPRRPGDVAGRFVANAVESVARLGVDVEVVAPLGFRHFGVAYGDGIVQNLRASPWKVALVPAFVFGYVRAARKAVSASNADLVHAHWLPSALAARATGKPFVLQLWGTDVELANRLPALFGPLVRQARVVVGASTALVEAAERLGARRVELIPSGVDVPARTAEPESPPHVLFVGRLSPEKGILDFVAATEGLPRRIVGDGPLRAEVPEAAGFVSPDEVGGWYDRASVVCVPSLREGYGMTAREAMAHGRALVATRVGGLEDAFDDGESGIAISPGDVEELGAAVRRLLGDEELRARLGAAARAHAVASFSRELEGRRLVEVWESVAA